MKSIFFINRFTETLNTKLNSADCRADWAPQKNQLLVLLQGLFDGKENISWEELKDIKTRLYSNLSTWPEAQATGLAGWAKMIFDNITNYAHSALTPLQGSHERYKSILAQTKKASTYGYKSGDDIFTVDPVTVHNMQVGTKRYTEDEITRIVPQHQYADTPVRVHMGDTFTTALLLKSQGYNPVVLNMACDTTPGGGSEQGYFAQEESLYYRSNYYLSLDRQYNPHAASLYPIPEFGVIYSPYVTVIRDENYQFSPPWSVSIIAAAAYNIAGRSVVDEQWYREGTAKKIEAILKVAAAQKHDCVLLGAFGCGAFRKDANTKVMVSEVFKEVIQRPQFFGVFRNISFAIIPGLGNLEEFQKKLNFDLTSPQSRAKKARTLEIQLYGTPTTNLDNLDIDFWSNEKRAQEYLTKLNNDLKLKQTVESARTLETELHRAPITKPWHQVSREWWANAGNVHAYFNQLNADLRIKRQIDEVRRVEIQLHRAPITPTYDKVSKQWWSNQENVEGYLNELLKTCPGNLRQVLSTRIKTQIEAQEALSGHLLPSIVDIIQQYTSSEQSLHIIGPGAPRLPDNKQAIFIPSNEAFPFLKRTAYALAFDEIWYYCNASYMTQKYSEEFKSFSEALINNNHAVVAGFGAFGNPLQNDCGSKMVIAIAEALKHNLTITRVFLPGCDDAGMIALIEALKINRTIQEIYFSAPTVVSEENIKKFIMQIRDHNRTVIKVGYEINSHTQLSDQFPQHAEKLEEALRLHVSAPSSYALRPF